MITPVKIRAMKRIKEEFTELNKEPMDNLGITVGLTEKDDIFEWQCSMRAPIDTSYAGGCFILIVTFPDNYPESGPEVCFKTPIYHINVKPTKSIDPEKEKIEHLGHVCISTLNWWSPQIKMREVLSNIFGLFYLPNVESPYGPERSEEFNNDRPIYEEKAKFFTKKYADPLNPCMWDSGEDWDFSTFQK